MTKTVLITGAGSGLGKALSKEYVNKGNHVIMVGRNEGKLLKASCDIDSEGSQTTCYVADITSIPSIQDLKKSVVETFKTIDLLINCAGLGYFGPFKDLSPEHLKEMFEVNVFGTIYMTQHFIEVINQRLVNIISTAGLKGKVNESGYVASKFAVRGFTDSIRKEYEDSSLIITAVYMGGMDTPFWNDSTHIVDKSRLKSPEVIAKAIVDYDSIADEIIL